MMTPEDLKAEADANNAAWRCGTFDTKGKEALEYFTNLTHDPQDAIMTIEDMEKVIKFHEDELDDYGDDFSDLLHIARRLLDTVRAVEQERDEARQEICIRECDSLGAVFGGSPKTPHDYAKKRGWDCFRENNNG